MEIRQLRYFLKIVDMGSLSKASQVLHVAQPALSYQMNQLEKELGQQLLRRNRQGVQMTEPGEAFYRLAARVLKELDDLPNSVRKTGEALSGTVCVGLPQSTAAEYAMPLLAAVQARHPGIALELFDELSGHLLRGVHAGRLDLAVMVSDQDARALASTPLLDEELFFVSAPHRSPGAPVPIQELAAHALTLPGLHQGVRSLVEDAVRAVGQQLPRPRVVANSMSIMLRTIASGAASGIMPWAAVSTQLADGSLRAVPLAPRLRRRVHVCHARDTELSLAGQAVKELLIETTRERVAAGLWQGVDLL